MKPEIQSYDGFDIQDTTYEAFFPGEEWVAQARAEAIFAQRAHTTPKLTYVNRQPHHMAVGVRLKGITANGADTLKSYFDTADPTEKKLLIQDTENSNKEWYVMGACVEQIQASQHLLIFVLAVGDRVWTEQTQSSQAWPVTGTGDTQALTVGGNRPAQAILEIKPTAARSGGTDNGFSYERFVTIKNNSAQALLNYPIEITNGGLDTDALTPAKMQADGDDVRVYVDGVETERWFADFDTVDTEIWIVLDLPAQTTATLFGNHNDSTTTFTVTPASKKDVPLRDFPAQGFGVIESEIVFWSAKSDKTNSLTVTRGVQGTSAAAHVDGTTIQWIPDVRMFYGNSAMSAPSQTDAKKPIFELDTSTNGSWDYNDFAVEAGERAGSWSPARLAGKADDTDTYTANHATDDDPASEMGMSIASYEKKNKWRDEDGEIVWSFTHPCGVTTVTTTGEKYRSDDDWPAVAALQVPKKSGKKGKIKWSNVWNETTPASEDTWTNLAVNGSGEALGATYNDLRYALVGSVGAGDGYLAHLEVSDVTLTLTGTPTVSLGSEQSSTYEFDATITNNTTSKAITIQGAIPLNDTLVVDGESKQVYLDSDGSPLMAYVRRTGTRFDWLALSPGSNTLQYDEDGAQALTITIKWRDRNN